MNSCIVVAQCNPMLSSIAVCKHGTRLFNTAHDHPTSGSSSSCDGFRKPAMSAIPHTNTQTPRAFSTGTSALNFHSSNTKDASFFQCRSPFNWHSSKDLTNSSVFVLCVDEYRTKSIGYHRTTFVQVSHVMSCVRNFEQKEYDCSAIIGSRY